MKYSRLFVFMVLMAAAAVAFGAYDGTKPADNEYVADVPALVRENFRAVVEDAIVNAGTVSGYSVGSASGNIPRNDGSLNINLNVDKLDNKEATDFTATSTFTAHENDTSTHGVAQVAGIADVNNALSAANASDALNLRLDGSRAMTGNLRFSGNYGILQSTSDGADNALTSISGGGDRTYDRGGHIKLFGNEYASVGGQISYAAGNVSTGDHVFYTGSGIERMRITSGGRVGIGVTGPYSALEVSPAISLRNTDNGTMRALHGSRFGYSGSYKAVVLGGSANNETICIGYDPINNTTSQFSGNGYELLMQNGMVIKTPNRANNTLLTYMKLVDGNVLIGTTSDDGTNKLQVTGNAKITGDLAVTGKLNIPQSAGSNDGDIWLQ